MLQSFISRNNDIEGYWALGQLYDEHGASLDPLTLDLLGEAARSRGVYAQAIVKRYALYLRAALLKLGVGWETVTHASISLQFNAPSPSGRRPWGAGDVVRINVKLATTRGHAVERSMWTTCMPRRAGWFTESARTNWPASDA